MYVVYVLWDKIVGKFYIGFTTDLQRRLREHKAGKVHTTKRYKSVDFIYCETFLFESDARRREEYLKTTKGKKGLRLILRDSINKFYCPVVP